jgi:hypothetical protein
MSIHYIKDTKKFWQEREIARTALDKKRSGMTNDQKKRETKQVRSDYLFLKRKKQPCPNPKALPGRS